MASVDAVVIGAGVLGLACARALTAAGREVVILEREAAIGSGISSRNSEVVHAGLYYAPGSLKARLCVRGRAQLYEYCRRRQIPHRRTGKLVVALQPPQTENLQALLKRARDNGVTGLRLLDRRAVRAMEPELAVAGALYSPDTGIVDSHGLLLALLADAEAGGATLARRTVVTGGEVADRGMVLDTRSRDTGETLRLQARLVVNAAGLAATDVAGGLRGLPPKAVPRSWYARGVYFSHPGPVPFGRLIYPVPEAGGLGVHLTLDLAGQARFGPDVEWLDKPDFTVDPARSEAFDLSIRRWWPQLAEGSLVPGYAGVRPRLAGPGMAPADFRIDGPAAHGVPGLVNLFGMESPGLTACLAIADQVVTLS